MKGKEASGLMLETEIIQTRLKTKLKTKNKAFCFVVLSRKKKSLVQRASER